MMFTLNCDWQLPAERDHNTYLGGCCASLGIEWQLPVAPMNDNQPQWLALIDDHD